MFGPPRILVLWISNSEGVTINAVCKPSGLVWASPFERHGKPYCLPFIPESNMQHGVNTDGRKQQVPHNIALRNVTSESDRVTDHVLNEWSQIRSKL